MGDHDQRRAQVLLQPQQQVEDLGLDGRVERGGGLVGDDELGLEGEGHRDHRALPHAAGELVRVVVDPGVRLGDADPAKQLDRPGRRFLLRDRPVVRPDHLGDLPPDLVERMQAGQRVLEDHRDPRAAHLAQLVVGELEQVGALEHRAAPHLGARGQPEQRLREHGLAAARLADDAEGPPGLDVERHAPDRPDDAVRRSGS